MGQALCQRDHTCDPFSSSQPCEVDVIVLIFQVRRVRIEAVSDVAKAVEPCSGTARTYTES